MRKPLFALVAAFLLSLGFIATPLAHAEEGEPVTTSDSPETPAEVAAPSISMKPTNEYVLIKPSETSDRELTITNSGNVAYSFRLYTQPYTIDDADDSYNFAFNTINSHSDIYKWVTFDDGSGNFSSVATYHINPGEEKKIAYRVNAPSVIPAGGQYAAIFAETINEEADTGNINGIYTVSRVALLLYGRSNDGVIIESKISDYEVPSFMTSGKISASSRVQSLGNADVTANYKIIVRGIFGNELYSNTWSYPVLPDTTRFVRMTWEDTPGFGIYTVEYSVTTVDKSEDHTTVVLILPIWMIIAAIILLTIIIIWTIMGLKKRKERKSRLIV